MEHQCTFRQVINMATTYHDVNTIYRCDQCDRYHVCDGGSECLPLNTGENLVCIFTGKCIGENIQNINFLSDQGISISTKPYEDHSFENIIESLKRDIQLYFSRSNLTLIKTKIFDTSGELKKPIEQVLKSSFKHCKHLFSEITYAYDLVCSMYIHVIISVYSARTVYGNLLFKCTKNKKHDMIVKNIRKAWMSTLITGDTSEPTVI
ncbi:unknown [Porcine lymphotropic herpesvirus 2]|uniref:Protein UL92 n=1 Tax=Suid gammaherpesvirus 4 TaxID=1960250 RepID=Q8B3W2_9GAMA|nr:unknown [Porcine lymphotropic herpesvirus 2]AAO12371.1 unknown [Porcine lymphotropic herpesvirus 2]